MRQQQTGWDGALQRAVAQLAELEALIAALAAVIGGAACTAAAPPTPP